MCEDLAELAAAVGRFARAFDPALVSTEAASSLLEQAAAIEAVAASLVALCADRAADDHAWRDSGARSPAGALAARLGTSVASAKETLSFGRRLSYLGCLREAAADATLSSEKARMVAQAAEADRGAEERLVDLAQGASLVELKEACQKTIAAADRGSDRRRRRIHTERALRAWTDVGGTWHLSAQGPPEDGAQVLAALHPFKEAAFGAARRAGHKDPEAAYGFDGLVAMATETMATARGGGDHGGRQDPAPASCRGAPAKVLIRVDYEALRRGFVNETETAEIAGVGPVPVEAIRQIIATDDPFLAAVLTDGTEVLRVTHFGRKPTAKQKTALEWLYPTCSVDGCGARARLEVDHTRPWALTRHTVLSELDCKCDFHHDRKTRDGWEFIPGTHVFVAPSDPRHPSHARAGPEPKGPCA